MGKKRKITCLERAVAQIVKEYGFKYRFRNRHDSLRPHRKVWGYLYDRSPLDAETATEIVAILRDACPSCHFMHSGFDEDGRSIKIGDDEPTSGGYNFTPKKLGEGRSASVLFVPDSTDVGQWQPEPMANLILSVDRPSLWQRIKGRWPW